MKINEKQLRQIIKEAIDNSQEYKRTFVDDVYDEMQYDYNNNAYGLLSCIKFVLENSGNFPTQKDIAILDKEFISFIKNAKYYQEQWEKLKKEIFPYIAKTSEEKEEEMNNMWKNRNHYSEEQKQNEIDQAWNEH